MAKFRYNTRTRTRAHSPVFVLQRDQADREDMKLLSLLLAPVGRIHAYLSHIQVSRDWFESALFTTRRKTRLGFPHSGGVIF